MASYLNLVLCIVWIWSVSSVHLASQDRCSHNVTLYFDWKKFDNSPLTSIPQYDSRKIFDVLRNHCIEIILENITAQKILCITDVLDGGIPAANRYYSGSNASILINSITDAMSTKWKCDVINQNSPIIRILFELKVKGAIPLIPENPDHENNTVPSTNELFNEQQLENNTRVTNGSDEVSEVIYYVNTVGSKYNPRVLFIGCVAGMVAVSIVACCTVIWCIRKRNAHSFKNDPMEKSFEDDSATTQPQNEVNSFTYDYAYNKRSNSILTRPLPPCPEQKSFGSQLKKARRPSDEESNYYSEIDELFISQRNARGQQKHVNLMKCYY